MHGCCCHAEFLTDEYNGLYSVCAFVILFCVAVILTLALTFNTKVKHFNVLLFVCMTLRTDCTHPYAVEHMNVRACVCA